MTEVLPHGPAVSGPDTLRGRILDRRVCSLCGACVELCPYIAWNRNQARFVGACGQSEGSCSTVCPMRAIIEEGAARNADAPLGSIDQLCMARASEPSVAEKGQVGGSISAILIHLLESGQADPVLVASPSRNSAFPLLPASRWARTREEVLVSAGTRYVPRPGAAALNRRIQEHQRSIERNAPLRLAMVGRPCEIRGARRRLDIKPPPFSISVFMIGVFCMWSLDHDLLHARVSEHGDVHALRNMDVGPQNATMTFEGGRSASLPVDDLRTCVRPACRACPDFSSEAADISVGATEFDPAWNALVIRTPAGRQVVEAAVDAHVLEIRDFPLDRVEMLREAAAGKKRRAEAIIHALG